MKSILNALIKWIRDERTLKKMRDEITLARIEQGVSKIWSIEDISRGDTGTSNPNDRLRMMCKQYLIAKSLGVDAAVIWKLRKSE